MPRPPASAIRAAKAASQAASKAAKSSQGTQGSNPTNSNVSENKQRSIYLICLGVPLLVFSSVGLYKRVIKGEAKKVQVGEMTPDGQLRMFSEEEILEREKSSYFTRIFGTETWTSGFRK